MKKIVLLMALTFLTMIGYAQAPTYINGPKTFFAGSRTVWYGDVTFGPNAVVYIEDGAAPIFFGKNMVVDPAATFISLPGNNQTGTGKIIFRDNNPLYPSYPLQQTLNGGFSSGTSPSLLNIEVDNVSGLSLTGNTRIANTIQFTRGHIYLNNFNLVLANNATFNNFDVSKHVVTNGTGVIVKEAVANGASFLFPVSVLGTDYTPATVGNDAATRNISLQVKDYTNSAAIETIFTTKGIDRTWQISSNLAGLAHISLQHNTVANANGTATDESAFANANAYVTQQITPNVWLASCTGTNGGSPVSTNVGTNFLLPASVDATSYFTKRSVTEVLAPVVMVTAQPACGTPTGSIAITATMGYTYSIDGGAYTATLSYDGLTPGPHSVLAKNADGCISTTATNITIDPAKVEALVPVVTVTSASCSAAGTATINNYVATQTYTFSPSGPSVGAGGVISGMMPGTSYTVTTNNGSCSSSASSPFSIGAMLAAPTANISYNPAEYQATGTASVIQTGQTGGTYTASPTGLSINPSTGQIDLAASTPNQSYTVTYTFSNGSCTNTATAIVKVNGKPASIAYANPAYCAIGTASIIRTGAQGGTYSASPTGLSINASTGQVNLATSKAGLYTITYNYLDGNITASSTTTITVNALPIVAITTDIATGNSVSLGDVVTITATGGVTYSWTGDDIQSGQNANIIKVRPKQAATYKVTVTNANGCSEVMEITIGIVADRKLIPNNVITPNGDGKNDTWVVKNLDYYPKNTVTIYDRAGRRLYSTQGYKNDWDGTYQGLPLAEGAYVYVIDSGEGIGLLRGTINIIRDQR